jgi:hypothetical protein
MEEQRPSAGRIVHYVLIEGTHKGEHRPAIVVRCEDPDSRKVDLQVFHMGVQDDITANPLIVFGVKYQPEGTDPRSWHWPERV